MKIANRDDVRRFFESLMDPLFDRYSEGKAYLKINGSGTTYSSQVIGFEGFCRPLWGLVPYLVGGGDREERFTDLYLEGIKAGSDPDNPEFWGHCVESDQRFVEMGALAFALLAKPDVFWDRLDEGTKDNLSSWLLEINDHDMPHCNWLYFRILVNLALKRLGRDYSRKMLALDAAEIESWYAGDGCYVDGASMRLDYYMPFALHFYGMLISILTGDGFDTTYGRAEIFYENYKYLFSETGESVPYGRSQTYRFATVAFFAALALMEKDEEKIAEMKGYVLRCLRHWSTSDMCSDDGILSIGYEYPNLTMAERYNSPTSPYWAFKAFLVLMIPSDHPFWRVREKDAAVPCPVKAYPKAGILMQNRGWDATIYPTASRQRNDLGHFMEKYAKFAYSTAFPFSVTHSMYSLQDLAPDSNLVFEFGDGRLAVRRVSSAYEVLSDRVVSSWSPDERIEVKTEIIPNRQGYIRHHIIRSSLDVTAYECGFAIDSSHGVNSVVSEAECLSSVSNNEYSSSIRAMDYKAVGMMITAAPNTNMKYRNTVIPALRFRIRGGVDIEIRTEVRTESHRGGHAERLRRKAKEDENED